MSIENELPINGGSATPARGTWHDHIYVSEFMGLQFELPETWFVYTEEERFRFTDMAADVMHGHWSYLPSPGIAFNMEDMRAEDFLTGNGISIQAQVLSPDGMLLSEREFLQGMKVFLSEVDAGIEVSNIQIGAYPRQLGDIGWYYMSYALTDVFGRNSYTVRFINMQDELLCTILLTIKEGGLYVIDEIWGNFSEIAPQLNNTKGIIPTMHNAPSVISRGSWNSYTYTNPSLNLKFSMPYHLQLFNDSDLAALNNVPISLLHGDIISADLWTEVISNRNTIHIMGTHGNLHDNHIIVDLSVRSVPRGIRSFPITAYLQFLVDREIHAWQNEGHNVNNIVISENTLEIARHEWYAGGLVMGAPDCDCCKFRVDILITLIDNHIWKLWIVTSDEYELQEVLAMFSQYY